MVETIKLTDGTDTGKTLAELLAVSPVDLKCANLLGANLEDAVLGGADLRGADLRGANLEDADLMRTIWCRAALCGAKLNDRHKEEYLARLTPEEWESIKTRRSQP